MRLERCLQIKHGGRCDEAEAIGAEYGVNGAGLQYCWDGGFRHSLDGGLGVRETDWFNEGIGVTLRFGTYNEPVCIDHNFWGQSLVRCFDER